jgi:FlaA1/EpsC-like NDP-sugar epimerase
MTSADVALAGKHFAVRLRGGLIHRLGASIISLRGRHLLVLDLLLVAISIGISIKILDDAPISIEYLRTLAPAVALPLVIRPIVNFRSGLYRRLWRHASVPELLQVVLAVATASAVGLAVAIGLTLMAGLTAVRLPLSFWLLEFVLSLALLGGVRFAIRAGSELGTWAVVDGTAVAVTPTLLFGAGRAGALMARSARREPSAGVRPVGFLDEDRSKLHNTVAGLPVVGGLDRLSDAIRVTGARMLLITLENPSGDTVRRIMDAAIAAGLQVRTVPSGIGRFQGSDPARHVRDIRMEDLLTREQVIVHAPGVAETIRDQVVMVTGAGGSIGSELARQVYGFGPKRLVLVDRAESPLYMIQRELELSRLSGLGRGELSIELANVASRQVMRRLIAETRPAVIFHAAAYKHVPMMEEHPSDGVQVNVGGTMAVLSAAIEIGVPRFVLVSTDKAVEPSSVMGATKRLAEWLVADAAVRTGRPYVAVRFGNVLGSAGSVLPIFEGQLEKGEPITITHPDMTRYFMTMQEAGWLILDAAAIGRPGDLFVLDMGEPVRIVDMARDLIRLTGRREDSVPIRFTGLRPGEKLHERLFYASETVGQTEVDKILRVVDSAPPPKVVAGANELLQLALGDRDDDLRATLFDMIGRWPDETVDDGEDGSSGGSRKRTRGPGDAGQAAPGTPVSPKSPERSDGVPVLT